MTKREHYSWRDFGEAVEIICSKLRQDGLLKEIKGIYGIPRGGLVLAVALSHKLDLPLYSLEQVIAHGHALVVDDISDSGETLKRFGRLAECTATIHLVPGTSYVPDVWAEERSIDSWMVYPWEV